MDQNHRLSGAVIFVVKVDIAGIFPADVDEVHKHLLFVPDLSL